MMFRSTDCDVEHWIWYVSDDLARSTSIHSCGVSILHMNFHETIKPFTLILKGGFLSQLELGFLINQAVVWGPSRKRLFRYRGDPQT